MYPLPNRLPAANQLSNYFHLASCLVINYCIRYNISKIIIGHNIGWKTDINIGKRNNQNLCYIHHNDLIHMIKYNGSLEGIDVITTEESYTSKCSFPDMEPLCHHISYLGKRTYRGLFISSGGIKINCDINGSLNILRKECGDVIFTDPINLYAGPLIKLNNISDLVNYNCGL